jgi:hypothetical protein
MPGGSKKGGGLEYTPYKMKGSPMKRNFGIGRTESPEAETPLNLDLKTGIANATTKLKNFWTTNKEAWRDNVRKLGGATEGMDADQLKKAGQLGWGKVATKALAAGMRTLKGGYDAFQTKKGTDEDDVSAMYDQFNEILGELDEEQLSNLREQASDDIIKILDLYEEHELSGKGSKKT